VKGVTVVGRIQGSHGSWRFMARSVMHRGQPLQLDLAACRGVTDLSLAQLLPPGTAAPPTATASLSAACSSMSAADAVPADVQHGTALAADSDPEPSHPRRLSQVDSASSLTEVA